jgi:hypothetical protein
LPENKTSILSERGLEEKTVRHVVVEAAFCFIGLGLWNHGGRGVGVW